MDKVIKIFIFCLFTGMHGHSQTTDTLAIDLHAADSIFLLKNYFLLAQHYQIEADRALVIQEKVWDNPEFTAELGMNSINRPRPMVGRGGQTAYSIDQVIQLAGKRNKRVRLAELNADYSDADFYELMRTLKLQLHVNFYSLYFQNRILSVLREQETILENIVKAYERADSSGSVAHADYIRLKALQVNLRNDFLSAQKESLALQQDLQQLLGITNRVNPMISGDEGSPAGIENYHLQTLIDSALNARPDIRMAGIERQAARMNYSLQKALAVPDLHVGAAYEKAGGVVDNYVGITLGIDLPFWNRNRGNIRSSSFIVKQRDIQYDQQLNNIQIEVISAYEKLKNYQEGFGQKDLKEFQNSYKDLIESVATNFAKGNISLLQFIDFFNSYSDNVKDLNGYYQSLYEVFSELEFSVGMPLKSFHQ